MHKIDKEWRISIPEGLAKIAYGKSEIELVWAQIEDNVYCLIPLEEISQYDELKFVTGPIKFTEGKRIFIPSCIRREFPKSKMVQIYMKAKKLYIEF